MSSCEPPSGSYDCRLSHRTPGGLRCREGTLPILLIYSVNSQRILDNHLNEFKTRRTVFVPNINIFISKFVFSNFQNSLILFQVKLLIKNYLFINDECAETSDNDKSVANI